MNTTASNARLHKMVGCALFAALTAVCSQLAIPMPWGVPINLALFAVYMAGTMLGPVWGAASQLVYLLLAAVGVPVMAGMQGGPAVLLGKTGDQDCPGQPADHPAGQAHAEDLSLSSPMFSAHPLLIRGCAFFAAYLPRFIAPTSCTWYNGYTTQNMRYANEMDRC